MPDVQTTGTPPAFPASFSLTELERDLEAWYFPSFPTAPFTSDPRPSTVAPDRPVASLTKPQDGPGYVGTPIASSGLALLALAALLTAGCGSSTRAIDRQLAAQVAAERSIADAALAGERARVAAIHAARR